jgi:molecular chaperone GrpE (heat shock protein)
MFPAESRFYFMLNFEFELEKLLSRETGPLPQYEFAELAAQGGRFLEELNKKQTDVSLQIEEIYDLVKEQDTRIWQEAVNAEKTKVNRLVHAAIALSDLLEDFCVYARQSGSEELRHQAGMMWENAGGVLLGCGILRFGETGQMLNPQIHTVKASAESDLPREQVVQVLQSGYLHQNILLRKAAVVVSRGPETAETWVANPAANDMDAAGEPGDQGSSNIEGGEDE